MRKIFFALFLLLATANSALAGLNVVATLPWIGSLAREIGQDKISVTTLIKPSQDPHTVEAKPSMILAARKADLLMYNGLDLEIGYLPLILESSRNPRLMPGQPGNLDCSQFVTTIEKLGSVDRSMGDVHPLGNPHYHFSPANILAVAQGMTEAMARIDSANAELYRRNFKGFVAKFNEHRKSWPVPGLAGKRYVAYHKLFEYLAAEFGLRISGYIEAKPGIPPSAAHIEHLIEEMKAGRPAGILVTSSHGLKEAKSLGEKTGLPVIILPQDVGALPGTDDWFAFMDKTIAALR